jgi:hypothetical protein
LSIDIVLQTKANKTERPLREFQSGQIDILKEDLSVDITESNRMKRNAAADDKHTSAHTVGTHAGETVDGEHVLIDLNKANMVMASRDDKSLTLCERPCDNHVHFSNVGVCVKW